MRPVIPYSELGVKKKKLKIPKGHIVPEFYTHYGLDLEWPPKTHVWEV